MAVYIYTHTHTYVCIYTHLHINARVSWRVLSLCPYRHSCLCSRHSWVNIEPPGYRGSVVRGSAALQLYIYHSRIAHCARNRDGMPIGRKNAISAPPNA